MTILVAEIACVQPDKPAAEELLSPNT